MALHLDIIHICFISNGFRVIYQFSEINWSSIIRQLVSAPSFCLQLLSKSLVSLMNSIMEDQQGVVMTLQESEAKIICEALSGDGNALLALPDFYLSPTPKELLMLMRSFCTHSTNKSVLLSQQSLLPTLHKLLDLYATDVIGTKLIFLLLINLSQCPIFESAVQNQSFIEPILKYADVSNVLLRNVSSVLLHCLQKENIDPIIQVFFNETAKALLEGVDITDHGTGPLQYFFCSTCEYLEVSSALLSLSNEGDRMLITSDMISALFKAAASIFKGINNIAH